MCMLESPTIPDPVKPAETQAARAPTRAWAANPGAKRPGVIGGGAASTARPATAAPGMVLGR